MNERNANNPAGNLANNPTHSTDDPEGALPLSPPDRPWAPNISNTLKAPLLPGINPKSISHDQAYAGIAVHIPGSPLMKEGDTLVFHWGLNESSTRILHAVGFSSTVRVLCIAYSFIAHIQYGLVDVYFEVYRNGKRVGTSPALLVTVNPDESKRARQPDADD